MEAELIINLLSRIRHDYGNHLQVIMGYIDLGRPEKARRYVNAVVEQLDEERRLFEELPPEAALYFYQQALLCSELGLILKYRDYCMDSHAVFENGQEPYSSLKQMAAENAFRLEEEPVVYADVTARDGKAQVVFSGPALGREVKVLIEE
jgi:hypothetical protein